VKKALVILALALSGCAVFTKPTGVITIPRQDFINAYGLAKAIYLRHAAGVAEQCRMGQLAPDYCARAQAAAQEAKRLDLEVEAKLLTPEKEVNWAAVMKMLEFTAGLVL
jgi:hypothetical protein